MSAPGTISPSPTISLLTPDPEADALRRRRLRQMRTVATSLLVVAAIVYVVTLGRDGVLGYVNAAAEASMVGAVADWFAVTAIFKRPLGLPIPHTALIPRRKDDLGRSLEDFVGDNFLQEEIIRERLASAEPSRRASQWLRQPANAERVVREAAQVASIGLRRVRDEDIAAIVNEVIVPRLKAEPFSPVAGRLLAEVVADDAHHGLVDLALEEAHRWLVHNQDTFTEVLGDRAPWWSPAAVNERVTERAHLEAIRWVSDIRADPRHQVREALDSLLEQLADDLLHDAATQQRAERLKDRLLDQPQLIDTGLALWNALRKSLVEALDDESSLLRARAVSEVTAFAERLGDDAELRGRLDAWAADLAVFVVERYGDELTAVITQTVDRWDGKEASSKIELHVGRDLQFIRINGTVVGGLVGLVIHAFSQVVS